MMSNFWSIFVVILVLLNLIGCGWLLYRTRKNPIQDVREGEALKHSFDGIKELNTPLPRWWLWLFWLTLAFVFVYLALYPGLGHFKGTLQWDQEKQYQQQVVEAEKQYKPLFAQYYQTPIAQLATDKVALDMGRRLFVNNCATCHGADARGAVGFPDLRDAEWLYGDSEQAIEQSILKGRSGAMPPMAAAIGGEPGVKAVVAYVRNLNGLSAETELLDSGKRLFANACAVCHGPDARGNAALGAPDLTNNIWLYGSSEAAIAKTIREGKRNMMPAHEELLGEEKSHILAAYIYHFVLQQKQQTAK